jgi:hypothetical protein
MLVVQEQDRAFKTNPRYRRHTKSCIATHWQSPESCAAALAGGVCRVDESHLTGESDDVVKEPPAAVAAGGSNGSSSGSSGLSSCLCMSGSKVLEGFGRMLVLAVGPNSQQVGDKAGDVQQCCCVVGIIVALAYAPLPGPSAPLGSHDPAFTVSWEHH